jgi:hypothetical protein
MEEMQITSDLTWIEVQFMKKAVDEVEKCRMTLKWTYAMAYYLCGDEDGRARRDGVSTAGGGGERSQKPGASESPQPLSL